MSAWGIGCFENDAAADWIATLTDCPDDSAIMDALEPILRDDGQYLEEPECAVALAAAEVVAAAHGSASPDLPDSVREWVRSNGRKVSQTVDPAAARAVSRIATESELRDLWSESDEFEPWQERVASLLKRLG